MIFVIKFGLCGDFILFKGKMSSDLIVWLIECCGLYMLILIVVGLYFYVFVNNGVFDVYDVKMGCEIYC